MLMSALFNRVSYYWEHLTQPPTQFKTMEKQQQAILLASLSLLLLISALILLPIWVWTSSSSIIEPLISLCIVVFLTAAYALSRTNHYFAGSFLLISVIFLPIVTALLVPSGPIDGRIIAPVFMLVAVLLTSILLTVRATVIVAASSLLMTAAFFFIPEFYFGLTFSVFVLIAVMSALIIVDTSLYNRSTERLHNAEAQYRGLYEQTHDAVFIIDLQGNYLQVNRRGSELLGYTMQEIHNLSLKDVSSEFSESQNILARLLAGEHIPVYERVFHNKDGTEVRGEINVELVRDADGKPRHIQSVVRDIGDRRRNEEMLRRQNKYLTVLHHVTIDLLNRRNRDDLLQSMINHVSEIIDAPYVELLFKEGDEMVTHAATTNLSFMVGDRGKRGEASLVWKAHDTREVVTVEDYATYPLRRSVYDHSPTSSVACFPIIVGQNCLGVLDLSRIERNRSFTPEELQQGTLFAQLVALLLDNVNLHESAGREIAQRKQTEDDLRTIQERQHALLSAIPDLIFRHHKDGTYLDYHAPHPDMLMSPPDQFMGRKISEIFPGDIAALHMQHIDQVTQSGQEALYEYSLPLPTASDPTYFETRMVTSGQDEVLAIIRDVTQRKTMEKRDSDFLQDMKALQEIFLLLAQINDLEVLYSNMVQLTQQRLKIDRVALFLIEPNTNELIGTYGVDASGHIRNERYYRETITENHWTVGILDSPNHACFWEDVPVFDNGLQIGIGWKTAVALWDGHTAIGYLVTDNFVNHQSPRPYQDELSSLLGSTYGHLIRLKQTQITLHRSEERHRALLSAIPDLMFRFDRNGIFLDYHSADPNNLAVPPEQFLGHKITEVMPPDIAALQSYYIEQVLGTGQEALYEYALPREGQPAHFESRMVVSGSDEVLTIIRDVTEHKKLEEQTFTLAVETARTKVLSQFVQNASHELRTPLSTINTALFLMTKTTDEAKREHYANRASEHIKQLSHLLDMMLSMTKLDSFIALEKQLIDLNAKIYRLVDACQDRLSTKGISLTFKPDDSLPPILGDPTWLQEALDHILDNAIRFTSEGGSIAITTVTATEDNQAIIEIADTGVGISEESLPHIFERFWRQDEARSTSGFGLGLSIALKTVEMHGGRIEVTSIVGSGTTFVIMLPCPSAESNSS